MAVALNLRDEARFDETSFFEDPWPTFRELRHEAPVYWYEAGEFWVVTKYEDIRAVNTMPKQFSNAYGNFVGDNIFPRDVAAQFPEPLQRKILSGEIDRAELRRLVIRTREEKTGGGETLNRSDPPQHTQLRKLIGRAFTPRMVRHFTEDIQRIITEAFDRIEPGEIVDYVDAVSRPVPSEVIAVFLGVPPEDRDRFLGWADAYTPAFDDASAAKLDTNVGVEKLQDYVRIKLRERSDQPMDDLISALAQAEIDGEKLDEATSVNFAWNFLFAGNETSRHLISWMAKGFAEQPDQLALVVERPELLESAVDEFMRWQPPAWGVFRTCMEDTKIRDQTVKKGDFVNLMYASACHDEDIWDHPEDLDITRPIDPAMAHLGFGHGAHRCPGSNLGRLDALLVATEFLARFRAPEPAGDQLRMPSTVLNGLRSLPLLLK